MDELKHKLNHKYGLSSIFFMINLIFVIYYSLLENLLSLWIINTILIVVSLLFLFFLKFRSSNAIFIFSLFLIIYGMNSFLQYHYQLYMFNTWNVYSDETLFYEFTDDVSSLILNGNTVFDLFNDIRYSAMAGFIYLAGFISLLSNHIDQNSVMVQKLFIVYISAFNSVILYSILKKYFKEYNALYLTIIFSLFSFTLFLSSILLRDQLVMMSYLLFFSFFLKNTSIKNFSFLLLIMYLSILIRPETGFFLIFFLGLYFINSIIESKRMVSKSIFLLLGVFVSLLVFIIYFDNIILMYDLTVLGYGSLVNEQAADNSFGLILYSLPYGLNYIAMTLFWQIQPFPFWSVYSHELINSLAGAEYILSGFFWYIVIGMLIISLLKFKLLENLDRKLLLLFIGSIVYIVLVSSIAPDLRRLIAVYPIIYLVSSIGFIYLVKHKMKYILMLCILYILLVLLYIALKGFAI